MKPTTAVSLAVALLVAASAQAEKTAWSQVPAAVQNTAHRFIGGTPSAEKTTEDGETTYTFSGSKNKRHAEVEIDASGNVVYLEQGVELRHAPKPVQDAIHARANGSKIAHVTKYIEDSATSFEAEIKKPAGMEYVEFDQSGKLISEEVPQKLAEVPQGVRNMIVAHAGSSAVDITKSCEGTDCVYDVDFSRGSKSYSLSINADGSLESQSETIALSQTPAAVQKMVNEKAAGAQIGSVTKVTEGDSYYFEVEMTRGDNDETLDVGPDGKIVD